MAGNLTNYAEKKILEHSVGKTTWTKPTSVWVGLFTALPDDTTAGTEVASNGYARKEVVGSGWNEAVQTSAASYISNASAITFNTATGTGWTSVIGVGIFDASTSGNLIWWGPLTAAKTVNNGDTFQFATGALSLSLD